MRTMTALCPHPLPAAQDPKLLNQLQARHGADLEAKSLSICSGTDMVNINLQHVILPDVETAKVRDVGYGIAKVRDIVGYRGSQGTYYCQVWKQPKYIRDPTGSKSSQGRLSCWKWR